MSEGATSENRLSREAYLSAMRGVAASVAVVTTDGPAGRHGATVTAFSSVSADPPTVLVCLHGASRIAEQVAANGQYCLNILQQEESQTADRFAGRHDDVVKDRFAGIPCCGKAGMPPMLEGAISLCCRVSGTMQAGSHKIFVAEVDAIFGGASEPLTYLDGVYRKLAPRNEYSI